MQSFDKVLVVVPARGGSKRIPNKNIKFICGQPMIYWPLMELQKFVKADNVLVSKKNFTARALDSKIQVIKELGYLGIKN